MLLELADRQAADPERLAALIRAGDQAWRRTGGLPEGFFTTGQASASVEDYLHVLAAWATAVGDGLTSGQRTMFWFLCCLEERDRIRPVIEHNWTDLWTRLELAGDPPNPGETLAMLTESGLVTVRPETEEAKESYDVHPGAAEAGRARAGNEFRNAVDTELAAYWTTVFRDAWVLGSRWLEGLSHRLLRALGCPVPHATGRDESGGSSARYCIPAREIP